MQPENRSPFERASSNAELPVPPGLPSPGRDSPPGGHYDLITIAQLAVSGLGMAFSFLATALLGLMGLVMLFGETGSPGRSNAIFMMAAVSLFTGLIAIPSLVFAFQRQSGRVLLPRLRFPQINSLRLSTLLLLIWPLVLLLGNLAMQQSSLSWLLLPPLLLLAAGIPGWWFIELARRGLPVGSRQRGWGLINFSIFISTPLLMILEIMAIAVLVVLFAVWAGMNPGIFRTLQQLGQQMANSQMDTEAVIEMMAPFMRNPWVILGVISVVGLLIPLIEELVKPLGVWLLAGRQPSPAEGFVAGLLCGAGFGVIESMLYLSNPTGENWALLAAGRAGTILLHTTTTALVGWAMALAWRNGAYLRLIGTFLLAVALHGLWNAMAVLSGFSVILDTAPENMRLIHELSRITPFGIPVLAAAMFGLLLWGNRTLRAQLALSTPPVETAVETRRNIT